MDGDEKRVKVSGGQGPGRIEWLQVEWVLPDAGAFGRDKVVPRSQSTAAKVEYRLDGERHEAVVTHAEADDLLRRAHAAAAEAQQAVVDQQAAFEAERRRVWERLQNLACPVCDGQDFEQQTSREDSQWGVTSFRMRLLICRRCQYVMHFSSGRSIFDFD